MQTSATHAIMIEPVRPSSLIPLLETRPFGLLPIANKPLLHHQLATLASIGIKTVDLFLSHLPHHTRNYVQEGRLWGLAVRCHSTRQADDLWSKPGRLSSYFNGPTLVLGMDLLIDQTDIAELIQRTKTLRLVGADGTTLPCLFAANANLDENVVRYRIPETHAIRIDSPRKLWLGNLAKLKCLGDTLYTEQHYGDGLYIGTGSQVHESVQFNGSCLIGHASKLERKVSVGPNTVIGVGVVADEATEITNSLIFDNTYIGPHNLITGKLVDGNRLVDIITGNTTYIDDPSLLATISQYDAASYGVRNIQEWLIAFLTSCAVALPLLGWIILRWMIADPAFEKQAVFIPVKRSLDGHIIHRELSLFNLRGVKNPALNKLPWLFAVLRNQLRLFGTQEPLSRPAHITSSLNEVYGMLCWTDEKNIPTLAAKIGDMDYYFHNNLASNLITVARWLRNCCQPNQINGAQHD